MPCIVIKWCMLVRSLFVFKLACVRGEILCFISNIPGLNLQSLNNSLAASLGTGIGTGLGTGFGPGLGSGLAMVNRGAPSLSALSTQVALSQQQPRLEGLRPGKCHF